MAATWKPHAKHGTLTTRGDLPDSVFAFPKERKEPLTDASHVRNALARFDQLEGVSEADRKSAFANIKKAAKHYGVDVTEGSAKKLTRGTKSSAKKKSGAKKKSSAKKKASSKKRAAPKKKATRRAKKKATR
jgi:hypothetical protein